MSFIEKLLSASRRNNSLLCVGLDPDPVLMPEVDVVEWARQIIEATKDLVCAYKPNFAFFEALGVDGMTKLDEVLRHIPEHIPVIGDAKRSDIGSTARKYARAVFEVLGCDAVTVNPFLGRDSIEPFIDYADRAVFVLCHTSNPGAADLQQLPCLVPSSAEPVPLYEVVAAKVREWNTNGNLGLVIGATQPLPLRRVREMCPDLPLLIPGIGAQRGNLASAVRNGVDADGEKAIITASRQVIYASRGRDFPSAARLEASKLRARINQFLARR